MISYLLEKRQEILEIERICELLNALKKRIASGDFTLPYQEFDQVEPIFDEIKNMAIAIGDERLANSSFVFKEYFKLFCNVIEYFFRLQNKEYRVSWNNLQDCLDIAKYVGRYSSIPERLEVPDIVELLTAYEKLYPYTVFCSSEFVISQSHCSICGKSMLGLDCPHIKGNLYWGEPAVEVIDKISELQAVCIVRNPKDKRCILELQDDTITEEMKFQKLDKFMELAVPPLQIFRLGERIETRKDSSIKKVGRNEFCPCGSGKKFKKCCFEKMFYKHLNILYRPIKQVSFIEL